jgi:hypothetical protein
VFIAFFVAKMLAVEGRCKTFGSIANECKYSKDHEIAAMLFSFLSTNGFGYLGNARINQDSKGASLIISDGLSWWKMVSPIR